MSTLQTTNLKHPNSASNNIVLDASGNATLTGTTTAASFIPTSSTAPTNGVYLPAANSVAISTNGTGRLFVDASGRVGLGTSSLSQILHVYQPTVAAFSTVRIANADGVTLDISARSGSNASIVSSGVSDALYFGTANTERMRLDSSGRLGLGTSSPSSQLDVRGFATDFDGLRVVNTNGGSGGATTSAIRLGITNSIGIRNARIEAVEGGADSNNVHLDFYTNSANALDGETLKMRLTSGGSLGIGTTSPAATTHCAGSFFSTSRSVPSSGVGPELAYDTSDSKSILLSYNRTSSAYVPISIGGSQVELATGGTERARIDSSGRLLVGTSTARSNFFNSGLSAALQVEGTTYGTSSLSLLANGTTGAEDPSPLLILGRSRGTLGGTTIVSNGDKVGQIAFQGTDGTDFVELASVSALVDGTPGANDMPGRLVFSTTADGASSPTERMRINARGDVYINQTNAGIASGGAYFYAGGGASDFEVGFSNTRSDGAATVVYVNRQGSDGSLMAFMQASTTEGIISVSGTTVTYGGGHLARWSQLANDEDPSAILKGTVMSNLNEMCEWGEEDNEQLNKTKVSDIEGDPNVAGVFVATSFSEDGPLDFFVGMTGDMIIRIAEGVTVQRGDLLMSAGDGTAKPQDDDIIRSKTVAKVTSTHVTCTYDDGSYCVPCVLMAC